MNYLDDVPSGKEFFLGDKVIKNLYGLLFELRNINDETYSHYVNNEHNYFSDWIEHVINYKKLADEFRPILKRKEAILFLEKEIEKIKEPKKDIKTIDSKEEKTKEIKLEKVEEKNQNQEEKIKEFREQFDRKEKKENYEKYHEKEEKHHDSKENELDRHEIESILKKVSHDREMKHFIWKYFTWEFAKEFMYGMAIGILIGFILARIFIRV